MSARWQVVSFEASRAVGVVRERANAREATFSLEAWVPCDAETAHGLQDSDEHRHLLLPQTGEPVDVEWKRGWRGDEVVARVVRATPLSRVLPRRVFSDWLERVGRIVPDVAGWTELEWQEVCAAAADRSDADLEATIRSTEPWHPESFLGLLAWVRANVQNDISQQRLAWVHSIARPGARRAEAWSAPNEVWLMLEPQQLDSLTGERLLVLMG